MKHNKKTQHNQHDPSLSSSLRCPLSDSVPKHSPTPQQTCLSSPIVYTSYSVDRRKFFVVQMLVKRLVDFIVELPVHQHNVYFLLLHEAKI